MTMTVKQALNRLNELHAKMKENNLNKEENSEFNALSNALEKLELPSNRKVGYDMSNYTWKKFASTVPTGQEFRTPNGQIIKAYRKDDKFLTEGTMCEGEAGEMVRALLIGSDRVPAGFQKIITNTHGNDPSGSTYLIPTVLSKQLWDLARAKSIASKAGVETLPLTAGNLTFIKTLTEPTPQWRGTISNAWHDLLVDNLSLTTENLSLKSVGYLCAISLEALESSQNAAQWIEQVMTQAVATAVDQAVFIGSGFNDPEGICIMTGTNAQTGVGSITDHSEVITAVSDVLSNNYTYNGRSLRF